MVNIKKAFLFSIAVAGLVTAIPATAEDSSESSSTVNVIQTVILPEENDSEDNVSLTISDGRAVARPGQILTFRAVVHNSLGDDANEIKITITIPEYLVPIATSPQAKTNPTQRTIIWENQSISAGADVTYSFKARVALNAPDKRTLYTSADINGPGIRDSATDETQIQTLNETSSNSVKTTPQISPTPPVSNNVPVTAKTGASAYILPSLLIGLAASIYPALKNTKS